MNLNEITSILGFNVKTFVTKDAVPQIINNQKLIGAVILSSELGDDSIVPYIVLNNGRTRRLDGGTYQYLQSISGSLKNAYDNFTDWSHLIETTYSYSLDILSKSSQVVDEATNKITYFEESTNQFYRDTNNTVSELTTKVNDTYNNIYDISNSIIAQTSYSVNAAIENSKYIYNPITYTYELLDYSLANLAIQSDKIRTDVNNRVNELSGYVTDYTTYITQTAGTISNVAKQVNEYYNDYTNSYNVVRSQIGALNVSYNNISAYVFDSYAYSISKLNQTASYLRVNIDNSYLKTNSYILLKSDELSGYVASTYGYAIAAVNISYNNISAYVKNSYAYSISKIDQTASYLRVNIDNSYLKTNSYILLKSDELLTYVTDTYKDAIAAVNISYNNISSYVKNSYAYSISKIDQTASYLSASIDNSYLKTNSYILLKSDELSGYVASTYEDALAAVKFSYNNISAYVRTLDTKINETRLDILNSNINAYADSFNFYTSKRGDTDATLEANKIGYISSNDGIVISKGKFSGEVNASKFIAGGNSSLHTVISGDRFEFYSDKVSYSIKELKGDNVEGNYGTNNYDWPAAYFFYSEIDSKPQLNLCLWGATIGNGEYRVIDLEKATMSANGYVPVQINSGTLSLYANPQTQTTTEIWWNGGSNPDLTTTQFYQNGKIGTTAPLLATGTKFYKKIKTYNAALSKLNINPTICFDGQASFDYTSTGNGLIQANATQLYGAARVNDAYDSVAYYRYWGQFNGTAIPVETGNAQDISMYVTNSVEQWAVYQVNETGNIINTNKYIYVATTNSAWNITTCIDSTKTASGTSDNPMIYSACNVELYVDSSLSVQSANRTIMRVNTYDLTSKNVYSVLQNNASYNVLNGLSFTKTANDVKNIATQYMADKTLSSIQTPSNYDDYWHADEVFTQNLNTITGGPIATTSKDADWIKSGTSHFTHDYSRGAVYNWTYSSYTNTWPGSFVYNGETIYTAMQKTVYAVNATIKAMNSVNIVDGLGNLSNAETTNVLTEVN